MFVGSLGLVVLVIVVVFFVPYCVAESSNISGYNPRSRGCTSYGPTMTKNVFVGSLGIVVVRCSCDCCHLLFFVPYCVAELSNLSGYKSRSCGCPSYGLTMIKNVFVGSLGLVALLCPCDRCRLCFFVPYRIALCHRIVQSF